MQEAIITTESVVSHIEHEREYGFDLTDFGDSGTFAEFLDGLGFDEFEDYLGRVETDLGFNRFVWGDENGIVVTGNNPITGEHHTPEHRNPEEGYASYIGIEGTEEFVATARVGVEWYADHIKSRSERRDYI